jgi:biotin carboxyl carrier protein
VLEAMKMQNRIAAHDAAVVKAVHVAPGETVTKGQLLVAFQ